MRGPLDEVEPLIVAVARKLVHVIYAVPSKQEPYDPAYAARPTASHSKRIDMKVPKCDSDNSSC